MPVKPTPVGPAGNGMLEPSHEELLARRHLRAVIRERMDGHISRSDHGSQYRAPLPELSGKLFLRKTSTTGGKGKNVQLWKGGTHHRSYQPKRRQTENVSCPLEWRSDLLWYKDLPEDMNILRGVFSNECDDQRGPFSSVFGGGNVSVS